MVFHYQLTDPASTAMDQSAETLKWMNHTIAWKKLHLSVWHPPCSHFVVARFESTTQSSQFAFGYVHENVAPFAPNGEIRQRFSRRMRK